MQSSPTTGAPPGAPGRALERSASLRIAFVAASAAVLLSRSGVGGGAQDRATALARALGERSVVAAPADVVWIDPPRGALGTLGPSSRAVVRGAVAAGEPNDLYLVDTQLSPEGVLLGVRGVYNLTETSGADESRPVRRGETIAFVARPLIEAASSTVHVLDLSGQPAPGAADWTRVERVQNAITNYQATGQFGGIGTHTFTIEPPSDDEVEDARAAKEAVEVAVALEDGAMVVRSSGREARVALASVHGGPSVDMGRDSASAGPSVDMGRDSAAAGPSVDMGRDSASAGPSTAAPPWVRPAEDEIARPGNLITWAVDRVRLVIGDDAMQTVKAVAFTALDLVLRNTEAMSGDTGAADIAADLGKTELDPATRHQPIDPELGWPPAPLVPWVTPALPGEGEWNPQGGDAFVRKLPGLPPAFLTTFIRSDRSRKVTRVYVALWDPRQVELHMMAGTVEPKGATGEAGPGLIPRTPEMMKRVIAGSNAGFQALHGEFGMMADGVVYLPPKPYAATVAVRRDGSTVFGTWSEDSRIPDWMLSYRQNMTVLVEDQKFNPFGRTWWGGTPPGWADKTHTVRTGICLTKERFVAYFYGADISPDALAQAMIQARCSYGIALDMNAGHSGLEFYYVAPAAELPPLGRPLQYDWETEGEVSGLDGWRFRGRRLIRGMGLMNFPRYIRREARDFFYMTLRDILPGPSLTPKVSPSETEEGEWRVKGLPQHGFPYALALTSFRPDASRPRLHLRLLKVDPRTVRAVTGEEGAAGSRGRALDGKDVSAASAETVAILGDSGALAAVAHGEPVSLWHSEGAFSIAPTPPVRGAVRLATVPAPASSAVAALGIEDEGGMLLYAELTEDAPAPAPAPAASGSARSAEPSVTPPPDPRDAALLDGFLKQLGCSSRLLLPRRLQLALGGDTDLTGAAVRPPSGPGAVRLVRAEAPGAGRMFESTPIVPFDVWYPLQQKRIRYFKKPQSEAAEGESNSP